MKKILCIILLLILPITFLCSCRKEMVDGDFVYAVNRLSSEDVYYVVDLSEEGLKKDRILMPSTYKGKKVILGYNTYFDKIGNFDGKVVYVPADIQKIIGPFLTRALKVIYFAMPSEEDYAMEDKNYVAYLEENTWICREYKNLKRFKNVRRYANVNYYYNYEDSPNGGYYFLDDYDNELISYIPEDPIREGYTFKGWYKESECINKWDFTTDKVESKEYIDDEYQYKETALYAKWELA
ncbi:MAG: InlB B-repeat-containing protein [Anaeroplasmataceae bacterium]